MGPGTSTCHCGFPFRMSKAFCDDFHVLGRFPSQHKTTIAREGVTRRRFCFPQEINSLTPGMLITARSRSFCPEQCCLRDDKARCHLLLISTDPCASNSDIASVSCFFVVSDPTPASYPPHPPLGMFEQNHKRAIISSGSSQRDSVGIRTCSFKKCLLNTCCVQSSGETELLSTLG